MIKRNTTVRVFRQSFARVLVDPVERVTGRGKRHTNEYRKICRWWKPQRNIVRDKTTADRRAYRSRASIRSGRDLRRRWRLRVQRHFSRKRHESGAQCRFRCDGEPVATSPATSPTRLRKTPNENRPTANGLRDRAVCTRTPYRREHISGIANALVIDSVVNDVKTRQAAHSTCGQSVDITVLARCTNNAPKV